VHGLEVILEPRGLREEALVLFDPVAALVGQRRDQSVGLEDDDTGLSLFADCRHELRRDDDADLFSGLALHHQPRFVR
jgi:hypothetical protein